MGIIRAIDENFGIFEGQFKNKAYNGFGRYICLDGEYYIGYYKDGARNGYGRVTDCWNRLKAGLWENGHFIRSLGKDEHKNNP